MHGAYYLALHFWIDLFGASELSVRFPSTIAAGVVVAGTVILVNLLAGRRVAVLAGIVAIVLPRIDYLAAEGRSYAAGTALAVWLTVRLVTLIRRRVTRALPWVGYGILFSVSVYLFLYLVLIALVHGVVLLGARRGLGAGQGRQLLRRWSLAVGLGVLLAAPIIVYGVAQRHQIAFLAHRHYVTFERIAVIQWFGNPAFAAAAWTLIAVAGVALVRQRSSAAGLLTTVLPPLLPPVLLLSWLFLPMTVLLLGNSLVSPMYSIRYLSFCAPAAAILIAIGVARMPRLWLRVVVVALLVALALPTDIFQRSEFAKDGGSDLRQTASVIGANAKPGDAVVFEEGTRPSRAPRLGLRLYPQQYAGLADPTLVTPYAQTAGIWDTVVPISRVGAAFATTKTVWDVELAGTAHPVNVRELQQLGFRVARQIPVHRTVVYELVREAS